MKRKYNIQERKKKTKEPDSFYVMVLDEESNLVDEKTFETESEKNKFLKNYKYKLIGKNSC